MDVVGLFVGASDAVVDRADPGAASDGAVGSNWHVARGGEAISLRGRGVREYPQ